MNEDGVQIERLTPEAVDAVSVLARDIWQLTYPPLISQAQIDAMLDARYASDVIRTQLDDATHAWWVARAGPTLIGFAHAFMTPPDCKLDKLYVHPRCQRRGIGRQLFTAICQWSQQGGAKRIWLQVNRGNAQAIGAYQRYGFRIRESRVFDIGNGFVMDDHVMEYSV
ncbi:MAG: GNAT family N-acetyltransferase [Thiobacillus sp.]|nr:GNAT family N-acetyltransferase [Thiobacillus sp.]